MEKYAGSGGIADVSEQSFLAGIDGLATRPKSASRPRPGACLKMEVPRGTATALDGAYEG